jgi:hypothetical protein
MLEEWLGPGIQITPVSLEIDGDLPPKVWAKGLRRLVRLKDEVESEAAAWARRRWCAHCRHLLPLSSTPRRRFCSDTCRVAAHRRRRAGVAESTPKRRGASLKAAR